MIRLKSIDNFRGITIIAMIWLHLSDWWLSGDFRWFAESSLLVVNYVFWVSFQFISGISTFLFLKSRRLKIEASNKKGLKTIKKEFLLRAVMLLVVSLIYNSVIAVFLLNPLLIWSLFMILSIAISLIMVRPLLETSKWTRLFLGIFFMVFNFVTLSFLEGFQGQFNIFGIIYYILYNPINLHPIFSSFAAFLIGTVIGETIFEIYLSNDRERRRRLLKRRILIPSIISGGIIVAFVCIVELTQFLNIPSFYYIISSLGVSLILFSAFVIIEEYELIKTEKSHRFIFYFSYYSLTIYLAHNLLYFLFLGSLNILLLLMLLLTTIITIGILLKLLYEKTNSNFAIKVIIGKFARHFVRKGE
ncbi:MAG: acyltransferase family protein [Candidatus Hermodarchaeota archaeon]